MRKPVALLSVMALAATLAVGWLFMPLPPERYYDQDLNPLAMTAREGFCSGMTYWTTNGKGDGGAAKDCRKTSELSTAQDVDAVVFWFCKGAQAAGYMGHFTRECKDVINGSRMWPTLNGKLSVAFNDSYPWPGDVFVPSVTDDGSDSRTGDRGGFSR